MVTFITWAKINFTEYRIAGKCGGELNLVVWRSTFVTAKLKSSNISYLHTVQWEIFMGFIFVDGQSLPFHRFNFRGYAHSRPLCTIQSSLFWGFNFLGQIICKNCEKWTPQFPTIQHICMAIPYRTTRFKSADMFAMAILGPTTKFNSRQYFWLYDIKLSGMQRQLGWEKISSENFGCIIYRIDGRQTQECRL